MSKKISFGINKYFHKRILNLALRYIKLEALTYPCFGLVSKKDSGCHYDMDIKTFLISQKTFKFYFKEIYILIIKNSDLDFLSLRKLGQKQEKRMFKVTNNVNTHKGLIFVFGIIYYISLYGFFHKISFDLWSFLIKKITKPLVNDFQKLNFQSKSKQIFTKFKILGARGEALSGYSVIFNKGLPFLKYYSNKYPQLTQENKCLLLLIFYLAEIDDTTLIFKIGYYKSQEIKQKAKEWLNILFLKGWKTFYKVILKNNDIYKKNKVSPGGCADLCVVTLFLSYFYKKYDKNITIFNLKHKF
ncbi:triphosphoribosyl-dephospho-CoA synthase [Candidatus Phytoplasma prunorum]|uniref:triphosphoribosyl-dephospho-CoA synthase n=1 Tax=Candidatus Phytoplasma prunorum TaxID=47565 RepID=UPI002FF2EFAF